LIRRDVSDDGSSSGTAVPEKPVKPPMPFPPPPPPIPFPNEQNSPYVNRLAVHDVRNLLIESLDIPLGYKEPAVFVKDMLEAKNGGKMYVFSIPYTTDNHTVEVRQVMPSKLFYNVATGKTEAYLQILSPDVADDGCKHLWEVHLQMSFTDITASATDLTAATFKYVDGYSGRLYKYILPLQQEAGLYPEITDGYGAPIDFDLSMKMSDVFDYEYYLTFNPGVRVVYIADVEQKLTMYPIWTSKKAGENKSKVALVSYHPVTGEPWQHILTFSLMDAILQPQPLVGISKPLLSVGL
jgi:hypothetical protein